MKGDDGGEVVAQADAGPGTRLQPAAERRTGRGELAERRRGPSRGADGERQGVLRGCTGE